MLQETYPIARPISVTKARHGVLAFLHQGRCRAGDRDAPPLLEIHLMLQPRLPVPRELDFIEEQILRFVRPGIPAGVAKGTRSQSAALLILLPAVAWARRIAPCPRILLSGAGWGDAGWRRRCFC